MPASSPSQLVERIPFTAWANLHAHLIWIYDGAVEPRWRRGVVESPHMTAWLVRAGSVKVRLGNRRLHATAGQWVFPPSGDLWREFSEDAVILSVRYRASWPTGEDLFDEGLGIVFPAEEHPSLERAARPLARFAARTFPEGYRFLLEERATLAQHLQLQALFARWLEVSVAVLTARGLTPSRMGRIDARLLKAVHLIDQQAWSEPFAEREVARQVGLSLSQLERLFTRQFGLSPRSYGERRRQEHAIALLQSSPQSIKEIAYHLGFSSLPHFSAWCRRRHGMSPRAIRIDRGRGKVMARADTM
jgi:AraC-like DNA-binding protein